MDRIENEATRVVQEHDGIVNQFVGDEIVAFPPPTRTTRNGRSQVRSSSTASCRSSDASWKRSCPTR
jgi:class 3 adenylate cyclase